MNLPLAHVLIKSARTKWGSQDLWPVVVGQLAWDHLKSTDKISGCI